MKILIGIIMLFVICSAGNSQDIITYMNGDIAEVEVLDISKEEISFRNWDKGNSPILKVDLKSVFMVEYSYGEKVVMNHSKLHNEDEIGFDQFRYSGPKVGLTFLGQGKGSHFLKERGYNLPLISQFGWQFETRLFTLDNKTSGLLEWIILVGGVEKGLFLPSASMIFGLRNGKNGLEFGFGPNLSVSGFGMAFAAGGSLKYGKINVPVNLAFVPSIMKESIFDNADSPRATGFRLSLLIGFNTRVE